MTQAPYPTLKQNNNNNNKNQQGWGLAVEKDPVIWAIPGQEESKEKRDLRIGRDNKNFREPKETPSS